MTETRRFDVGAVVTGPGSESVTIVGASPQWADGSDATYAQAWSVDGNTASIPAAHVLGTESILTIDSVEVHMRARHDSPAGSSSFPNIVLGHTFGPTGDYVFWDTPGPATEPTPTDSSGTIFNGSLASYLPDGYIGVRAANGTNITVFELWLNVTGTFTATGPYPLRQYPAGRSSNRIYPPRRTGRPGWF